jgi:hypothetical protein
MGNTRLSHHVEVITPRHYTELNDKFHSLAALSPEIDPSTHRVGGRMGSRVRVDATNKRKMFYICRKWNPGRPNKLITIIK